jgi:hypothetical protein
MSPRAALFVDCTFLPAMILGVANRMEMEMEMEMGMGI